MRIRCHWASLPWVLSHDIDIQTEGGDIDMGGLNWSPHAQNPEPIRASRTELQNADGSDPYPTTLQRLAISPFAKFPALIPVEPPLRNRPCRTNCRCSMSRRISAGTRPANSSRFCRNIPESTSDVSEHCCPHAVLCTMFQTRHIGSWSDCGALCPIPIPRDFPDIHGNHPFHMALAPMGTTGDPLNLGFGRLGPLPHHPAVTASHHRP